MKLRKKALLYDISNLAYVIADTGDYDRHTLHRVRDICEDGNIHRVSRVLGLSYSQLLAALLPVLGSPSIHVNHDQSASPHDYLFCFREDEGLKYSLTNERKLKIKETCHEYMVSRVLEDWLSITLPEAADVWKFKADRAMESLGELVSNITVAGGFGFRRKVMPI